MKHRAYVFVIVLLLSLGSLLTGCGRESPAPGTDAYPTPEGRIVTANQGANSLSVIDVATDTPYATVPTGNAPHHVVASPDATELWVTLYNDNHLQVFDAGTLKAIGQVELGGKSDDLTFAPDGKRLYVSMGQDNQVAVVDVDARKLVTKVAVGRTPHGVKVRPDGKELYVTNTAENSISIISLDGAPQLATSVKVGADPFEVTFDPAGKTAYISDFLQDTLSAVDTGTHKIKTIRVGKQPAMLAFVPGGAGQLLWIANTNSQEVWIIDPAASYKLVTRIPAGGGTHGVVPTPAGKVFVTNTNDNTVTVIDTASQKVVQTVNVGTSPNGLTFLPNL